MKTKLIALVLTGGAILALPGVAPASYIWSTYGGHTYAITDHGTWAEAEAEAVAAGGHLATINDASENAWLTTFIADCYARNYYGQGNQNAAWIGYENTDGNWQWVSGAPVTYYDPTTWWDDGGTRAYVLGASYVSGFGEDQPPFPAYWGNNPLHSSSYVHNFRGVIEVPEPTTLPLLALGGFALIRRKRSFSAHRRATR